MKILMNLTLTLMLSLTASLALAVNRGEQKQVFGDYEVHYIGLNSTFLTPDVAEAYGITRSGSLGYLSISILKNDKDAALPTAVAGKVTGQLRNLIGQSKELEFKEIKETNAVYYISTFRFDDGDMYNIRLQATPEGQKRSYDVKFSQRFYKE
ncbi:DUF4426 domain-containing protein [Bacterioplanoides sp.]|uniref:DUF4426 domain-containing protein n=1 Tax=Bacterioplanoides sp. TaxID=2066072 RepID=UPI003B000301